MFLPLFINKFMGLKPSIWSGFYDCCLFSIPSSLPVGAADAPEGLGDDNH
jgi:hypothetical protein